MTMQDRFKFRVWLKDSEQYVEEEASECHINHNGELICGDWVDDGYCGHYDYFNDDEVIIEQCTGLKDRNGKLIYEGDILGGLYGAYIKWCPKHCGYGLFYSYGNQDHCMHCEGDVIWDEVTEDDGQFEVVGNIHENADLLENKDESI